MKKIIFKYGKNQNFEINLEQFLKLFTSKNKKVIIESSGKGISRKQFLNEIRKKWNL